MDNSGGQIRIHRTPKQLLPMGHWFPLPNEYVGCLLARLVLIRSAKLIGLKRQLHGYETSPRRTSQRGVMSLTVLASRGGQRTSALASL